MVVARPFVCAAVPRQPSRAAIGDLSSGCAAAVLQAAVLQSPHSAHTPLNDHPDSSNTSSATPQQPIPTAAGRPASSSTMHSQAACLAHDAELVKTLLTCCSLLLITSYLWHGLLYSSLGLADMSLPYPANGSSYVPVALRLLQGGTDTDCLPGAAALQHRATAGPHCRCTGVPNSSSTSVRVTSESCRGCCYLDVSYLPC